MKPGIFWGKARDHIQRRKERTHGKHQKLEQGRTEKEQARQAQGTGAEESQKEAGLRSRLQEAQDEEDGAWPGEAVIIEEGAGFSPPLAELHHEGETASELALSLSKELPAEAGTTITPRPHRSTVAETTTKEAKPPAAPRGSQLLAKKSIDKLIAEADEPEHRLKKTLGPWSLTALGIGAIIGSGIFVLTGTAAAGEHFTVPSILHAQVLDTVLSLIRHGSTSGVLMHGRPPAGPAIAISFLLVAFACSFAGLCYAELASMIPIAGSAYTYSYATLGEIFAWIIGWDLILEYVVSNVAVSVGFSGYIKAQLAAFHVFLPDRWSTPVWEAGHWTGAYFNLPGFLIVFILTVLLVRGVRESAEANNIMVAVKIGAILTFLVVGGMLVHPANWKPFAPSGFAGVVTGGAIVFFTYIGFDSVSTAAEECRSPQRDLPFGIIASLIICTVLYVGVSIVLLGMMKYTTFISGRAAEAPVAYALAHLGASRFFQSVIVIGALTGMISSILVFQYGQARIWYAMSRDGMLPKLFSAVHPKFKTPHWSTWIAGFAVGIPAGIVDIGDAADLSNIGTLFAFLLVSLGVIVLRRTQPDRQRAFRVPLVPWFPLISVLLCLVLMTGLTVITWLRFFIWLAIGLTIYFLYSRHRSEFARSNRL
jgi:APA family basic amino acid/polyamine antiporter